MNLKMCGENFHLQRIAQDGLIPAQRISLVAVLYPFQLLGEAIPCMMKDLQLPFPFCRYLLVHLSNPLIHSLQPYGPAQSGKERLSHR